MHVRRKIAGLWRRNSFDSPGGLRTSTLLAGGRLLLLCLAAVPAWGQAVTTTVTVGTAPSAVAVNPVTNKIYIANATSNNVTVIDGATNTITPVATGTSPKAIAVNPFTNKIYVANNGGSSVTVINGADNTAAAPVTVGTAPSAIAINPVTNFIYVVNTGSNNVSVINGGNNTVAATVSVGTAPNAVAVNPVTNKIYVTNSGSSNTNSVTVIDATNNNATSTINNAGFNPSALAINPVTNQIYVANTTSGKVTVIDGANFNPPASLSVGNLPAAIAVNAATNMIYVANSSSTGGDSVSIIDGTSVNVIATVNVGSAPLAVAVNPVTNKIYALNNGDNTVSVIDGATNNTAKPGAGTNPVAVAADFVTNKIYVANQGSNDVTVIDGVTNLATAVSVGNAPSAVAVNPMTNKIYVANKGDNNVSVIDAANNNAFTPVSVGMGPTALAINPVTGMLYVANNGDNSVSVIDATNNNIATVIVGNTPVALAVNPVTNKIYVANNGDNNVTIIDAANNNATTTVNVGTGPAAVAVNALTNKIYVANNGSSSVTVINGADSTTAPPVSVGTNPTAIGVNPVTNTIYVANNGSSDVTVINGADNTTAPPISVGTNPVAIAVEPVSNKIYVANNGSANVTLIDGATTFTETITAGTAPHDIAVNPVTNKIYVPNNGSANVTVITEQQVQPVPLTTSITPVPNSNQFNFTTTSSYNPIAPLVQNVYFQFDSWQGPWLKAGGSAPNFTGVPPTPLLLGIHIIYAYAADGQFADSIQPGGSGFGQSSPIAGAIAAFVFLVVPEPSSVGVASSTQPSVFGQPVNFTATVTSSNFGTPSGTVTFTDGATTLGTATLDNNGQAVFLISTLTLGSHSISVSYSGDANFTGSNSSVFTQTVNQATSSSAVTLTGGTNPSSFGQPLTFTATVTPQFTGIPTGTITFLDKGVTILGPPVTLDGSAQASLTISSLAVGTHSITVVYSGDKNFSSTSVSPALPQIVKAVSNTNIALTSGADPSTAGNSLTFTATVGPQTPSVPTGTVTFMDNYMNNNTALASNVALDNSGHASVTTSSLAAGVHNITVIYSGDNTFAASTSFALTQVVMAAGNPSNTTLTVNNGSTVPIFFGFAKGVPQSANFVINVTGSNDGDSVVLLEGNQQLGPVLTLTGGQASWNSQLRAGVHNVQAVYIGNGTSAGSISTSVVVNRSPRPMPR